MHQLAIVACFIRRYNISCAKVGKLNDISKAVMRDERAGLPLLWDIYKTLCLDQQGTL